MYSPDSSVIRVQLNFDRNRRKTKRRRPDRFLTNEREDPEDERYTSSDQKFKEGQLGGEALNVRLISHSNNQPRLGRQCGRHAITTKLITSLIRLRPGEKELVYNRRLSTYIQRFLIVSLPLVCSVNSAVKNFALL